MMLVWQPLIFCFLIKFCLLTTNIQKELNYQNIYCQEKYAQERNTKKKCDIYPAVNNNIWSLYQIAILFILIENT